MPCIRPYFNHIQITTFNHHFKSPFQITTSNHDDATNHERASGENEQKVDALNHHDYIENSNSSEYFVFFRPAEI